MKTIKEETGLGRCPKCGNSLYERDAYREGSSMYIVDEYCGTCKSEFREEFKFVKYQRYLRPVEHKDNL